ncbi:MAG: hypothetical protein ABSB15_02350 [Bryobacteraceae bacterium]|jgi:hypothetical protein
MKQYKQAVIEITHAEQLEARLDLVVPCTTPELTMAAVEAANRLGEGLHAGVRLLKVQVVPWPLDLSQSPVPVEFLKDQLQRFPSALPMKREIRFAREFEPGLRGALNEHSLVILATRKRPWRTRTEHLAAQLRRDGYNVVIVPDTASPNHDLPSRDCEGAGLNRINHA